MIFSSKYLLSTLAVFIFLQGVGTSFFSSEILNLLGLHQDSLLILLVQLLGALQLGWGMFNFMCRNHKYGGIYGRPLLLANLAFLIVSGMAMLRLLLHGAIEPFYPFLFLTALYWMFAFIIFHVMRTDHQPN